MNLEVDSGWSGQRKLVESMLAVLALARDELSCESVAEVLQSQQFAEVLTVAGVLDDLSAVSLDDVPSTVDVIEGFTERVSRVVDEWGDVVVTQLVRAETTPMSVISDELGISREAVRRRLNKVRSDVEAHCGSHATLVAAMVRSQLPLIARSDDVDAQLDAVLSPIVNDRGSDHAVTKLARHVVEVRLDLSSRASSVLTAQAVALVDELDGIIKEEADDVGLIDLDAILTSRLPALAPCRDELMEMLELIPMGKMVGLRNTVRARAKAALIEIGHIATKEEIAALTGTPAKALSGALSMIKTVARADKDRWGLIEWIDDVYEGIPAAIEQRIAEHGGAVSLEFLMNDISERFNVKSDSVATYVGTLQYQTVDGMVSMADPDRVEHRQLEEVATRDADGNVCWDFKVEQRFERGYSIVSFPKELAHYLGCKPNSQQRVRVSDAADETVMISWRLNSIHRSAEIGRVRDTLARVGFVDGEQARLVILPDRSVRFVRLDAHEAPPPQARRTEGAT